MDQPSALAASVVVESVAVAILLARQGWATLLRGVAVAALATLATHPVAWSSIRALEPAAGYWAALLAVEALVFLVEAVAYRLVLPLKWRAALVVSAAANGASVLVGLAYYAVVS